MKRFWLNFWIHVCIAADTRSGNLNVIVNGEMSIQTPNRNMTEFKNVEDIEYTLSLFDDQNSVCKNIWTPITDKEVEGQFKNEVTRDIATFLPWEFSESNGFMDEDHVLLKISSKVYFENVFTKKASCTACDLDMTSTFSLIGVCENTFVGENEKKTCLLDIILSIFRFNIHAQISK